MAKRKYKMTGCARFFFILIIVIPLAYMTASYINGQDGWENLKQLFRLELPDNLATDRSTASEEEIIAQPPVQQEEDVSIEALRDDNQELRQALKAARDSIKALIETGRDSI